MDQVSYQGGSRFSGLLIGLGIELFLCCFIDSLEHRSMTSIYQVLKELQDTESLSSVALAVEREQSATVLTMRCKHSEGQRGFSSLTLLSFCISLLGEEHGLPLLTQDSNSKARRGILRRAVFSEDQRKALERMFQKQKYISKTDRRKLAVNLGLKESQVPTRRKTPPISGFSIIQLVLWHECLVPGMALCPRVF